MNTFNRVVNYSDGTSSIIEISSNDNYNINLNKNYKLANKNIKNNRFKNSILTSDIGFNSHGFASIATIATLISISAFIVMVLGFRI